jgi:intracellular septation protein
VEAHRTLLAVRRGADRRGAAVPQEPDLPERVWGRLQWSWVAFFAFMGAANLYVAYNFSTDLWVNFKLFGGMGLMFLFVIAQSLLLAKYVEEGSR